MNKPTARNVCWSCKRGDRTLYRLRDEDGSKLPDYICIFCKNTLGLNIPPIGNASKIYFPKELTSEEKKELSVVSSSP